MIERGSIVAVRKAARRHHTCPEGRDNHRTATVVAMWNDGEIKTDRDLRGCRYWNAADLRVVRKSAHA